MALVVMPLMCCMSTGFGAHRKAIELTHVKRKRLDSRRCGAGLHLKATRPRQSAPRWWNRRPVQLSVMRPAPPGKLIGEPLLEQVEVANRRLDRLVVRPLSCGKSAAVDAVFTFP